MFEELEFTNALNELDNPILEEYEFFTEYKGVKIYRKYITTSGLYEYKVLGNLACDTETCQQVYMDLDYRKKWDSYVKELREEEVDGKNVIYWNYTYVRECRRMDTDGKQTWVILCRSHVVKEIPAKAKIVRVDDYKQFLIIQQVEDNITRAFMHYYDNPGGSIPTWLINWAAKKGVPAFLDSMIEACKTYQISTK